MSEYWCWRCGQHMEDSNSDELEYYCQECLSGHRAPIFRSLPDILPPTADFSREIGLSMPTPTTLIQMQETTLLSFQNVPPLPFDILSKIHDYAHPADLPALCRVSKTFHDCASNLLYRDISAVNILDVCRTLSQSPGLASRVRHFELTPASRVNFKKDRSEFALVGNALRSMTRLRSLKLTMGKKKSDILAFCTAQIQSFEYSFLCDDNLIRFLHSQLDLTRLKLWCDLENHSVLSTCLPKLTKLDAPMSWLIALVPGRPIKEVVFLERRPSEAPIIDIAFLESSLQPIRTLTVGSPLLHALTLSQVRSILPALEKLTIETLKMGKYFHDTRTKSFGKWLQELLSALPALTSITLFSSNRSFSWFDQDALSFVETVIRLSSNIDIFIMESLHYSAIRSTWRRVDGKWSLSHRERQGVSQQELRLEERHKKDLPTRLAVDSLPVRYAVPRSEIQIHATSTTTRTTSPVGLLTDFEKD